MQILGSFCFFFSSRRRHTRFDCDWSSDVCSSDLIEPPELETCVAILMTKAQANGVALPEEVAFFIAKRIRSNVRELEGAMRRVIANSRFTGRAITLELTKEALRDLLSLQAKLITVEDTQKTVADYYKVRLADLLSKRRSRSMARPRQVAMARVKERTSHSLPEIGDAFGGRDHTIRTQACAWPKRGLERRRQPFHGGPWGLFSRAGRVFCPLSPRRANPARL